MPCAWRRHDRGRAPGRSASTPRFCADAAPASPSISSCLLQVRHPGVGVLMERDFTLMRRCAQVLASLPLVGNPQIKESLMQVRGPA